MAHGFVGDTAQLRRYLELGFFIGFNGIIFKPIAEINFEANTKITPVDRILIETDCPYLIPPSPVIALAKEGLPTMASKKEFVRNEPLLIKYVIQKIAEIKQIDYTEAVNIFTENAKKFFRV